MIFDGGDAPKSSGFRRLQILVMLGAFLFAVGAVCVVFVLQMNPAQPRPFDMPFTAAEIASIETTGVFPQSMTVEKPFEVPASAWPAILAALAPAHEDLHPSKWPVHGELNVKRKDGGSYLIMFSDDQFAAGPTFETRVYYRGADRGVLDRAVSEAFELSQKRK